MLRGGVIFSLVDSRTLILVLSVGNIVLALLLFAFDRSNRLTRAGRAWAVAKLFEGLGFLFLGLRGQAPDFLSIPVANALLFGGFATEFFTAQIYLRLSRAWGAVLVVAAVLLAGFLIGYASGMQEAGRIALFAAMSVIVFGSTGVAYLTHWREATILGRAFGLSYLAMSIIGVVRAAAAASGAGYTLMSNVTPQAVTFGSLLLFMLFNGFSFLLLAQEDTGRKLLKSRERLLHARRIARIASVEMDLTTGLPLWSSGLPELLGFPPGMAPPDWEAFRARIHPDDRAKVDDSVVTSQRGKALEPDEYRILGGDDRWRWLRREAELLPGHNGGPATILVTLQDISDRVRMEEEARQGYASLQRAQRMGKIGSVDVDLKTMTVRWSDELYRIYGRDPKDGPAGLDEFLALIHPDDAHVVPAIRDQYLRGSSEGAHEFRIVHPNGTVRWIHREVEQVHDQAGQPVRLVTVEQDVTERVRMEEELRRGNKRLVMAQKTGKIGSAKINLRTRESARSDEFYRVMGIDPAADNADDFEVFVQAFHPDDRAAMREIMRRTGEGESLPPSELRLLRPDGTIAWIRRHHDFVVGAKGNREAVIITIQDITEQKTLEQAKDGFVSTVSHELRTPLTSIRGALALAAASITSDVPEKVRHLIDVANRNSERLARLVDDLLDVQRISAGRLIYHMADVSISPLIEDAIEANRPFGLKHEVDLRLVSKVANAHVRADAERLMQVMANLLSNAIKYSKPGQTVEVSIERRTPWMRITVEDFGEGIPEAFHAKMFKPFSQSDSSDTRRKGGSGLGLSIVEAIVTHHQGKVSFETAMGKGTRFHVDLKELTGGEAKDQALVSEDSSL